MTTAANEHLQVYIRWMVRRDVPEVLEVENESFEFPWCEEDFIRCLQQRNCIGMVAEIDVGSEVDEKGDRVVAHEIVGFMIYELHKSRLHVRNFSVASAMRRRGVGTQIVAKLVSKLSRKHRTSIRTGVRETNLAAQQFFRSQGFCATSVLRGAYDDTEEDEYVFTYRDYDRNARQFIPTNRITAESPS